MLGNSLKARDRALRRALGLRARLVTIAGGCAILVGAMSLSGCQANVLDPQGRVGLAEKTILVDSLAIMLAIVVPTIAATLAFAWWYRSSNSRHDTCRTFPIPASLN
jgi:heme/copper-type cytochrome/quinol oxidase subunit 2